MVLRIPQPWRPSLMTTNSLDNWNINIWDFHRFHLTSEWILCKTMTIYIIHVTLQCPQHLNKDAHHCPLCRGQLLPIQWCKLVFHLAKPNYTQRFTRGWGKTLKDTSIFPSDHIPYRQLSISLFLQYKILSDLPGRHHLLTIQDWHFEHG